MELEPSLTSTLSENDTTNGTDRHEENEDQDCDVLAAGNAALVIDIAVEPETKPEQLTPEGPVAGSGVQSEGIINAAQLTPGSNDNVTVASETKADIEEPILELSVTDSAGITEEIVDSVEVNLDTPVAEMALVPGSNPVEEVIPETVMKKEPSAAATTNSSSEAAQNTTATLWPTPDKLKETEVKGQRKEVPVAHNMKIMKKALTWARKLCTVALYPIKMEDMNHPIVVKALSKSKTFQVNIHKIDQGKTDNSTIIGTLQIVFTKNLDAQEALDTLKTLREGVTVYRMGGPHEHEGMLLSRWKTYVDTLTGIKDEHGHSMYLPKVSEAINTDLLKDAFPQALDAVVSDRGKRVAWVCFRSAEDLDKAINEVKDKGCCGSEMDALRVADFEGASNKKTPRDPQPARSQTNSTPAEGRQAKPQGVQTKGPQPKSAQATGPQARGVQAKGPQPKGAQAKGPQPQGTQAKRPQPQGTQTKGPQPKGPKAKGPKAKGTQQPNNPNAKGPQSKGLQPKGAKARGPNVKGPQPRGDFAKGPRGRGMGTRGRSSRGRPSGGRLSNANRQQQNFQASNFGTSDHLTRNEREGLRVASKLLTQIQRQQMGADWHPGGPLEGGGSGAPLDQWMDNPHFQGPQAQPSGPGPHSQAFAGDLRSSGPDTHAWGGHGPTSHSPSDSYRMMPGDGAAGSYDTKPYTDQSEGYHWQSDNYSTGHAPREDDPPLDLTWLAQYDANDTGTGQSSSRQSHSYSSAKGRKRYSSHSFGDGDQYEKRSRQDERGGGSWQHESSQRYDDDQEEDLQWPYRWDSPPHGGSRDGTGRGRGRGRGRGQGRGQSRGRGQNQGRGQSRGGGRGQSQGQERGRGRGQGQNKRGKKQKKSNEQRKAQGEGRSEVKVESKWSIDTTGSSANR